MPFTYGSRLYSEGVYGGADEPALSAWPGAIVNVYDNTGARKGTYQIGVGDFAGCDFSHTEKGCAAFTLYFQNFADIEKKDIIKIKLFDAIDYFFTGVVRIAPIQGATKTEYNYSGFGLVDYVARINGEVLSYANKTIAYILDDIIDNIILPKTPITKNTGKLRPPDITVVAFDSNHGQLPEVFDALLKVANSAGSYVWGVDADGDFFFYERSDDTKTTLVVGAEGRYGIDEYNPDDSIEADTNYFLHDKDGVYISTITSTEDNDISEKKLVAPDLNDADAENWAEGILAENERITRSAAINWQVWTWSPQLLVADGNIRIISNILPEDAETPTGNPYGSGTYGSGLYGGGQYQGFNLDDVLRIIQVDYFVGSGGAGRSIQLGSRPAQLDVEIIKLRKDLTDLRVSLGR